MYSDLLELEHGGQPKYYSRDWSTKCAEDNFCAHRQGFSLELHTALFTELCIPPPRWSDQTGFVRQLDLQAERIRSAIHLFCGFRYDSPLELLILFRKCCLKDSGPAQPCRNSTPTWSKIALAVQLHSIERDATPLLDFVAELPNEASFAPDCKVQHTRTCGRP